MTYSLLSIAPFFKWFEPGILWQDASAQSSVENITHRIHLTRHDHHNLELKTFIDPGKTGFQGWLEVYLFVPGSFQLSRWDSRELRDDLHCRTRLAVSLCAEQGHKAMREAMRELAQSLKESTLLVEDDPLGADILVENSKDAGAVIHETLRRWTSVHRRQCRLAHSLMHRDADAALHLSRLGHEVQRTADSIAHIREQLDALRPENFPVLALLKEYTSSLYVKYLSEVENELLKCPSDRFGGPEYQAAREKLHSVLKQQSREETQFASIGGAHKLEAPSDEERESYLVRLSQLKKFFQSKMFVDISRRPRDKRIAETTAFVGTAVAGLSAAWMQQLYLPSSGEIAVSGMFLLGFGVFVYTVRDRIKDWLKVTLAKKASAWIADMEETLWVDGKRIGSNKEWSRVLGKKAVPTPVSLLRRRACQTEVETELPEEVFSWKRWQCLPQPLANRGTELALQENVRINLERYLKFMDDPFKELAVLDRAGQFTRFRSRRVYHFYLAVRSTIQNDTENHPRNSGRNGPRCNRYIVSYSTRRASIASKLSTILTPPKRRSGIIRIIEGPMKKPTVMDHPKLKKFLKEIPTDQFLFRQGQMGNTMFIILNGLVELIAEKAESSHVTGILEKGEFLGERAITMKDPYRRYYSAKAIQPTLVLEMSSQDLEFLRITAPDVMTDIMVQAFNVAARRLARLNILVRSLRSSNNDERFIRCIQYFCRTAGRPVPGGTEVALSVEGIHYHIDMDPAEIESKIQTLQNKNLLKRVNEEFFFVPDVGALSAELPPSSQDIL